MANTLRYAPINVAYAQLIFILSTNHKKKVALTFWWLKTNVA